MCPIKCMYLSMYVTHIFIKLLIYSFLCVVVVVVVVAAVVVGLMA